MPVLKILVQNEHNMSQMEYKISLLMSFSVLSTNKPVILCLFLYFDNKKIANKFLIKTDEGNV